MKKLLILCSLLNILYADALGDILSSDKTLMFDYQIEDNELKSDALRNSWVKPLRVGYQKDFSTQFGNKTIKTGRFSVSIDQPIFRSGGIYYGIKYAKVKRRGNRAEIELKKRKMTADAVAILFNLKKLKLQQQKTKLLVKNDRIDILQKRESYEAGLLDSSFLNRAILQKSKNETALMEMKLKILELKQRFSLLSDKNPSKLHLPKLKMMSKKSYKKHNLALKKERYRAKQAYYNEKITWAKYLPTVSVQGQYIDGDINPLFARPGSTLKEKYYNYSLSISMPLDLNSRANIQASKVAKLRMATQVMDTKRSINAEYKWIRDSLNILDDKINLAKQDVKIYKKLYRLTKDLADAGEKTSYDATLMYNSLKVRKIDQSIYKIEQQIKLLKLYARVSNVF